MTDFILNWYIVAAELQDPEFEEFKHRWINGYCKWQCRELQRRHRVEKECRENFSKRMVSK